MASMFHYYIYGLCFMLLCCDSESTVKSSQITNEVLSDTGAMNKTMVQGNSQHTDKTDGEGFIMKQASDSPVAKKVPTTKPSQHTTQSAITPQGVPSAISKPISTPGFKAVTNIATKSPGLTGGDTWPDSEMTVNHKQSPTEFMSTESEKITTIKPTEQKIIIKNDNINTSAKLMGPQMFKGDNKSSNNVMKNDNLDSMEMSTIVPETSISQDNVTMRLNKVEVTTKMPHRTTQSEVESPSKTLENYTTQQRNVTISPMITKLLNTHINDATLDKSSKETQSDNSTKSTHPVLLPIILTTNSSTVNHQGLPAVPVVLNSTNYRADTADMTPLPSTLPKNKMLNRMTTPSGISKRLPQLLNLTTTNRTPTKFLSEMSNSYNASTTSIVIGNVTNLPPVPIIRNETRQKILATASHIVLQNVTSMPTTVPSNASDINVLVQSENKTNVIVTPLPVVMETPNVTSSSNVEILPLADSSTTTKVPSGLPNVTTTIVKEATSLPNVTSGLQTRVPLAVQNVTTRVNESTSLQNVTSSGLQTQNVTLSPVLVTPVSVQTNASSVNLTSPTPKVVLSTNASRNMSGLRPIPVTISPSNQTSSSSSKSTSSSPSKPTSPSTFKPTLPSTVKPAVPSTLKPTLPPSSTSKSTAKPAKSTTEKPSITKSVLTKTTMGPTITVIVDIPATTDSNVTLTMAGLSTSALTAIITGSIIGFWVILGPLICLFCKLRDKRRDRRASNPGGYENVNKGIIDAMIMSELKRIAPDNPVRNKEVQYGTVAHDVEETTVLTNGHETNDHDRTSKIPITVL